MTSLHILLCISIILQLEQLRRPTIRKFTRINVKDHRSDKFLKDMKHE